MIKLDKKFHGLISKVKDGSIVPQDEYVVFLAKDTAFANILPLYYQECVKLGADEVQLQLVTGLIADVDRWRAANPKKCKAPDAKGEDVMKG